LERLISRHKIDPMSIGRLEIGTETIVDKSKSIKTFLMEFFQSHGNNDIEGSMSINACYGGTAALFNSLAWMESSAYDGRSALVIMTDIASYEEGPARPTGGAGAVAILLSENAPITFGSIRASHMSNVYDFFKPNMDSEYPVVDGALSLNSYFNSLAMCYSRLKSKYSSLLKEKISMNTFDQFVLHSPFYKQVRKSFGRIYYQDMYNLINRKAGP